MRVDSGDEKMFLCSPASRIVNILRRDERKMGTIWVNPRQKYLCFLFHFVPDRSFNGRKTKGEDEMLVADFQAFAVL